MKAVSAIEAREMADPDSPLAVYAREMAENAAETSPVETKLAELREAQDFHFDETRDDEIRALEIKLAGLKQRASSLAHGYDVALHLISPNGSDL